MLTVQEDLQRVVISFLKLYRFGVSKALIRKVSESGYDAPTPVQMQAIPILLQV